MYSKNILAVSGVLISAVAAVPLNQRDIVWVTETQEAIVTVPVTTTVWVEAPAGTHNAAASHYGHHNHKSSSSSSAAAASAYTSVATVESSAPAASSYESSSVYVAPSSSSVYVAPSSSSVYVAPTTSSSSVYVAPTTSSSSSVYVAPTSTYVAPTTYSAPASTTTSSAAAATSTSTSSSSSGLSYGLCKAGTEFEGDLTWYATGLGACGITSGSDDAIVAVSETLYDSYSAEEDGNPNNNPLCGLTVTITGVDGSPYTATIVDRCTGCAEGDLDLSEGFFNTVTDNGDGRVHNMKWVMN